MLMNHRYLIEEASEFETVEDVGESSIICMSRVLNDTGSGVGNEIGVRLGSESIELLVDNVEVEDTLISSFC